ncbi:SHOCT domain-containing protein [Candidatus Mycobacterium methanotrophicum]|uniref:SHOCT domain-containing protein n=1 Tax=Candidatus Mycobacterium methanotrophicum TaxID=2943498 RepID=A0ABY4QNS0_9MYCO|nr:SHOCT domain-containing protein [Candidatus Mycobacterium methanotrophicum]UQX12281.1 SHOCT domain-containing protein [Candidatus Mycobacterium methanotrophicum]
MKATVTPEAAKAVGEIAARHGLSQDAVLTMLFALRAGSGTMAQFNIPELGGSGQWMRGGMTLVGNMFDNALKARVDALCNELVQLLATTTVFPASSTQSQIGFSANNWWPADLGVPSAVGAQNNVRYAFFPATRRLAIEIDGFTKVFDTGEHHIGGVQQQQSGGISSVGFTSQLGTFGVLSLRELGVRPVAETPAAETPAPAAAGSSSGDAATIIAAIESLAGLHERGILSDEEFAAKKAELLARL